MKLQVASLLLAVVPCASAFAQASHSRGVVLDSGSKYIFMMAPETISASYNFVLPAGVPSTGQVLQAADNDGNMQWWTPTSLPSGAADEVLHGGTTSSFSKIVNADVDAAAAISGSKIQAAGTSNAGTVSGEESGTFGAIFTGPRSDTRTIVYSRVGNTVTLWIKPDTGSTTCTVSTYFIASNAIPSNLRPSSDFIDFPVFVSDNTILQASPGQLQIDSNGTITVQKSFTTSNFTGSGGCSFDSVSVTYPIN